MNHGISVHDDLLIWVTHEARIHPMRYRLTHCVFAAVFPCLAMAVCPSQPAGKASGSFPLVNAHAHNDYQHEHPLFDALGQGYLSIEADVCLIDGTLYVAHDKKEVVKTRTLQSLYLEPLRARVRQNKGSVYGRPACVVLLIDLKTEADPTYVALRNLLRQYGDMLTTYAAGKRKEGAVEVILSGKRPLELVKEQGIRYASYDGGMIILGLGLPASFIPLVSDRWTDFFRWKGNGPMPAEERNRLRRLVRQAHGEGRRVRFWDTDVSSPQDQLNLWKELRRANVDLIGSDKLAPLREFLLGDAQKRPP
jgi:hypothetical protein